MSFQRTIKELIKTLLPKSILYSMRRNRDDAEFAALQALGELDFNTDHLRQVASVNIEAIFNDPSKDLDWAKDHGEIAKIIGDKNLLSAVAPGERRAIYYLIRALKPDRVLEIGTHIGGSSLYIAAALNHYGGRLTTVDIIDVNHPKDAPWRNAGYATPPAGCAEVLGLQSVIEFVHAPAGNFLTSTNQTFDFIFLDGDHSASAVYTEVSAALKLLNPGGTILLHDFFPGERPLWSDGSVITGPVRALKRIQTEQPEIVAEPLGSLPWIIKLESTNTCLAIALKRN